MRLTIKGRPLLRRLLAVTTAGTACVSLTGLTLRSDRVGLEFSSGTAWLSSRGVDKIMLVDGVSGEVSGTVPLSGLFATEQNQSANPLLVWMATSPQLRRVDAKHLSSEPGAGLPDPASRLVGTTDGSYAFTEGGPVRYLPRDGTQKVKEIPQFTGAADDVVVDEWGEIWAVKKDQAVAFHTGRADDPIPLGSAGGPGDLVVRRGSATLFVPAKGTFVDLRTRQRTELSASGADLIAVENLPDSYVAAIQPPRTLIVRNTARNSPVKRIALGGNTTRVDRATQIGNRIYVPDLPAGRLLVYDLVEERQAPPIQIDDVTIPSAGFEMFVKDGMLWANELDGPNALVIRDGDYRRIRKYATPEQEHPTTGPVLSPTRTPDPSPSTPRPTDKPESTTRPPVTSPPVTDPPATSAVPQPGVTPVIAAPTSPGPGNTGNPSTKPEPYPEPSTVPGHFALDGPSGNGRPPAFSPDGRTMAIGAQDQVVVWDLPSRRPLGEISLQSTALTFSRDSRTLVIAQPEDNGVSILHFNARTLKRTGSELPLARIPEGQGGYMPTNLWGVTELRYSDNGRSLIGLAIHYAGRDHSGLHSFVWDPASKEVTDADRTPGRWNMGPGLSPDGAWCLLTLAGLNRDETVAIRLSDGLRRFFDGAPNRIGTAWTGNGARVAGYYDDGTLRFWSLATGHTLRTVHLANAPNGAGLAAANSDGSIVALTEDGSLQFWNTITGKQIGKTLTGYPGYPNVTFRPGDETVALTGSENGVVWLVEVPGH